MGLQQALGVVAEARADAIEVTGSPKTPVEVKAPGRGVSGFRGPPQGIVRSPTGHVRDATGFKVVHGVSVQLALAAVPTRRIVSFKPLGHESLSEPGDGRGV